jgi:hypothetical protein
MQRQSTIRSKGQGSALPVTTPAQKLEQARQRIREALRLAADETPSYAVLDDIARGLSLATRDLEEAAMAVTVLQRREAQS